MDKIKIIVVEDNIVYCEFVCNLLAREGFRTVQAFHLSTARKLLQQAADGDIVVSDLRLPDGNGIDLLRWMRKEGMTQPFIIMTDYAEVHTAVESMKLGSLDYIPKQLVEDKLVPLLRTILKERNIGRSRMPVFARDGSAFRKIMHRIRLVAPTDMSVLIFGENGTGKEHIAHHLHDKSKRSGKPFVAVDCGSLNKELAPSAFFGHVKGAFTGADSAKKGYFHEAEGGTLFLDEVGNLAPETQQMLLRAIQQRLCDWGKWLKGTIGFDGFRLDFVRGLQPEFVSRWVNGLPLQDGQQPFIVGEYWAEDGRYIKEWVDSVGKGGADVHAFDFPLKFALTEMCNKSGDEFDMSRMAHAGMIRGFGLPVDNVVTFVDNHDTGKEHDKWLVKDYAMAYAYILTHEGTPCVFYPHFYTVTQHDVENPSLEVTAPSDLQQAIRQLIDIRRQYLGGTLSVLTESDKHLYVARRQGNGQKDGAIIVLNNHDTDTLSITLNVNPDGFTDWSGQTLVNLLNPKETITIGNDGQATLSAPKRGYSIWTIQ